MSSAAAATAMRQAPKFVNGHWRKPAVSWRRQVKALRAAGVEPPRAVLNAPSPPVVHRGRRAAGIRERKDADIAKLLLKQPKLVAEAAKARREFALIKKRAKRDFVYTARVASGMN